MAVIAPLILRQRNFLAKAEVTTGTAESLTSAEGVFNCFDPDLQPDIGFTERQGQVAVSYLQGVAGARKGRFTLKTELFGSGSAGTQPSWADSLLSACGYGTAAGVTKPATGSASYVSLTMGLNVDGMLRTIAGATGTYKLAAASGAVPMFDWDFSGKWIAPTATAIVQPTTPTTLPAAMLAATFTIGGTAYRLVSFEIDAGNTVAYREDATDATGYHSTVVSDRKPTMKCVIESVAIGTHDFYGDFVANTQRAVSLAIGSTAGNICTIALGAAQLRTSPQTSDGDGVLRHELDYLACRVANAGDDEISYTWT